MKTQKIEIGSTVNYTNGGNGIFTGQVVDIRIREDWNTTEYLLVEPDGSREWRAAGQLR
jgi:hypothetical protein